jgi:D-amino-acid dehydrogenase
MKQLNEYLRKQQLQFIANEEVVGFEKSGKKIKSVSTINTYTGNNNVYEADEIIIATGSWSRGVAALLETKLPMMPGRGYSVTLEDSPFKVNYPAVLLEGKAAITPMGGNKIRFGGTMEITSHKTPPRMNRVQGVLNAVKRYYPEFEVPFPPKEKYGMVIVLARPMAYPISEE